MALVYIHRKKSNNKTFYVGISKSTYRPGSRSNRNNHWINTEKKHGFNVEIIENGISYDKAIELEVFLISTIGLDNLTNITTGGEGASFKRGKFSEEHKAKLSIARIGRKLSNKTKKRMSESSKMPSGKFFKESRSRKTEKKRRLALMKPVVKLSKDGKFVAEFNSIKEASESIGGNNHIPAVCKGKSTSAGGYKWKYKSDYE